MRKPGKQVAVAGAEPRKWTPGPWTVDDGDSEAFGVFSADGAGICYLSENPYRGLGLRPEDSANANLIAAAPDMYEALETMLAIFAPKLSLPGSMASKARAALAKARGEGTLTVAPEPKSNEQDKQA